MRRLIPAFLAAPFVAAGVTVAITAGSSAVPGMSRLISISDLDASVPETVFAWALVIASAATVLGAVPIFRAVTRRGFPSIRVHLLAGAALGISPFLILGTAGAIRAVADREAGWFTANLPRLAADSLIGGIAGTSGALVFLLVAWVGGQVQRRAT